MPPIDPAKASLSQILTLIRNPFSSIFRNAILLDGVLATIASIMLLRLSATWIGIEESDAN